MHNGVDVAVGHDAWTVDVQGAHFPTGRLERQVADLTQRFDRQVRAHVYAELSKTREMLSSSALGTLVGQAPRGSRLWKRMAALESGGAIAERGTAVPDGGLDPVLAAELRLRIAEAGDRRPEEGGGGAEGPRQRQGHRSGGPRRRQAAGARFVRALKWFG